MIHQLIHNGEIIEYDLIESRRARKLRLAVFPGGRVKVTLPHRMALRHMHAFLRDKIAWIFSKVEYYKKIVSITPPRDHKKIREEYVGNKEAALKIANERLEHFNRHYGFSYRRVLIKNQKTRWGSCSRLGNLNFNYKIALIRPELADYLVVHELCHLRQMNHSKKFWELVALTIPNYKILRRELRRGLLN